VLHAIENERGFLMEENDLDNILNLVMRGDPASISQAVDDLVRFWEDEDFESVEIFVEEYLTDQTPKAFLTNILSKIVAIPDFVEDIVAAIDGKTIIDPKDFHKMMELVESSRSSDSDEFNASRSGRASIALNPETPNELLKVLALDERWEIRYRVALNPSSTNEILALLPTTTYPEGLEFLSEFIEATVALHKNSSQDLLLHLASSENPIVRTAAACNPNASDLVIEKAKVKGVDQDLIKVPEWNRGKGPKAFRESRLCWWFIDNWCVADLSNLMIPSGE
jgi:hypothetical protein